MRTILAAFIFLSRAVFAHAADTATVQLARIQVQALQLSQYAADATGGNIDAFKALDATRASIVDKLKQLKQGDAAKTANGKYLHDLEVSWVQLNADADVIRGNKEAILGSNAACDDFNARMPVLNSRMDEVVKILTEGKGTPAQVMMTSRQMLLADRMQRRTQAMVQGGEDTETAANGLQRDAMLYGVVLAGLIDGNADLGVKKVANPNALDILKDIKKQWTELEPVRTKLIDALPALIDARQSADKAKVDSQTLLLRADALMSRLND